MKPKHPFTVTNQCREKQNEIGKYFNENRKGRRTGTEKVKAECDLFAKRASERGRTEQNNEKEKLKI